MVVNTTENNIKTLRRSDIQLSDHGILDRYLNLSKIPCTITSPFRSNDKNPSFRIFNNKNRIYWKDFGTGEHGTVVDLLARMWNISYKDAIERIVDDTDLPLPNYSLVRQYKGRIKYGGGGSIIRVATRKWKKHDYEFWESFGITISMCEFCNVYPISRIFFEKKDEPTKNINADKYAYAYFEWKDDKCTIKVYQPYSQKRKWFSSHDKSTWDLWRQAMTWAQTQSDNACIITSSRKDAMCLWQNLKIPAVSLQGEGYIPKQHVMQQVLDTFKTVYLWYDNDYSRVDGSNPGQDNAKKLMEQYPELKNICIPEIYKSKDPSDLYKNWGGEMLKMIFNDFKL